MKKKTINNLKCIIALEAILVLLFCIIVFAVSFENKFNGAYWVSFSSVIIAMIMIYAIIAIVFTQDKYKNDRCAKKILLASCVYSILSIALSLILIIVNGTNSLQVYIPTIIVG